MANCKCCVITIPDGQDICSMCYGDINYGTDGYYREQYENQMRLEQEQEEMMLQELMESDNKECD